MKKRIPLFCKVMEYVKFNESLELYAHSIFIIKSILTSMKARCYPSRSDVLISSEMWYFDINRRINIEYQSINQSIIFTKMRIIYFLSRIFVYLLKMRLATSDLHGLSFFLVKGYLNTPWYFSLLRHVLIRGTVMA